MNLAKLLKVSLYVSCFFTYYLEHTLHIAHVQEHPLYYMYLRTRTSFYIILCI